MDISRTSDVWWKNAVFYCLDVETFQDSNGDGIGDFAGLTRRLDHLDRLGVSCIWLMPFYPSPNQDDGYDITDYYSVDPRLGTLGDFVEFLRAAHDRGMRVIADLVVNHTSREHPWFQASRADPDSPYRDWYVWRDEKPDEDAASLVFPGEENSSWTWDAKAGKYYLHRFYSHQPDLNVENRAVRDEIQRIVGFWLQLGLSGFRVDAVPFLLEQMSTVDTGFAPHRWLRDLRAFINRRSGDAVLLGEVNLDYPDVRRFFGDEDGDELHMCLDFNLNQAMALALAREDAGPIVHGLRHMPELAPDDGWAHFLRNHDEWSLDKLTEAERQEVFASFGPDPSMQLFGRGLRRRMPTMLKGNPDRLRMAYALMASMPGSPVIFYGEGDRHGGKSRDPRTARRARRCSGMPARMAVSRTRAPRPCTGPWSRIRNGDPGRSMPSTSRTGRTRCSTSWSISCGGGGSAPRSPSASMPCCRFPSPRSSPSGTTGRAVRSSLSPISAQSRRR